VGWRISLQSGATVLSPTADTVISYDLEGRVRTLFAGGRTLKRALNSALFARQSVGGVRHRSQVEGSAREAAFRLAAEVAADAEGGLASLAPGQRPELRRRLRDIRGWTAARLLGESSRFAATYAPISILPPDQYQALVVQATFGCSWNRCSYCSFYQDRPFELRSAAALGDHLRAVERLLGRDALVRRSLFLADGNALVLANSRLRPLLAQVRGAFPGRPIAAFVDVFGGERKSVDDWRELRALGVERVAVGVETGHDPLLGYLNKPGGAAAARAFIATLKQAGMRVQAIFMLGVGGERFAAAHVADSAALMAQLPLGAGDTIYLSPFVVQPGSPYAERAAAEGLVHLAEGAILSQQRTLQQAARRGIPGAQVARYPIDEFIY
jgi:radical SAM superfamily enzyme YgiQ (UPF0313 family)